MQRWEYMTEWGGTATQFHLNNRAAEGWELVEVVPLEYKQSPGKLEVARIMMIFRRSLD